LNVLDCEVFELDFDGIDFFVEVFVVFLYVEELFLAFALLFFVLLLFECLLLELFFEFVDFVEFGEDFRTGVDLFFDDFLEELELLFELLQFLVLRLDTW
jgi:hypothetical protein